MHEYVRAHGSVREHVCGFSCSLASAVLRAGCACGNVSTWLDGSWPAKKVNAWGGEAGGR